MKKILLLLLCSLFFMAGCQKQTYTPQELESIPYSKDWLEGIDTTEWEIISCSNGYFSKEVNSKQNVYILKQYTTSSSLFTSSVLAVESGKKVLFST